MAATLTFDILAKDRASSTLTKVGGAAEKTSKKFHVLKTAAVTAGAAAAVFLVKFGKDSVKAFTEAEQAQTKLQDAFARFPKLADSNIKAFQDLNTELQKKTKFDDEAYASGQAVLAQFGLTGKQILKTTPLLGDYAAKTGKDVPTAAKLLGKAFLGNTKALKDLGIAYKPTGDKAKDMAAITQLVRDKVGGFAEKEGKTAAGQTAILGNQFGELEEKVGSKLVPALVKLAEIALKVVGFLQRNSDVLVPLAAVVATVVVGIKAFTVAQAALNVVMALNPITLIVVGLAALAVGLVVAYKKFEGFRNVVKGVFDWIKNNWPLLLGILTGPFGLAIVEIIKHRDTIWNAFKSIYNWFKDTWGKIYGFLTGVFEDAKFTIQKIAIDIAKAFLNGLSLIINAAAKIPGPLGSPFRKAKKHIDNAKASLDTLQDTINRTHGKDVTVTVEEKMKNKLRLQAIASAHGATLTISGKPILLAAGGPIRGPGGPTGDKIPAMLSNGEYVIKAASARKLGTRFLDTLNSAKSIGGDPAGMVMKFAAGGIAQAQAFVRAQASDPYIWGGVGPNGFDCSGLTGAVYGLLRGLNPFRRYFTTASNFAALGFRPGTGAYTIGVNPYTHMAGNIGGLPFEAANTRSGIHVGRGAQSVLNFAKKYYLASLGGVFGGGGGFTPAEIRQIMQNVGIKWGVPGAGRSMTFDNGGWLPPGRTLAVNNTGQAERVGPVELSPKTIKALGEVMGRVVLAGLGAANVRSARSADLYARAG